MPGKPPFAAQPPQPDAYAAAIFDLDAVVVDTDGLHASARQQLLDEVLPALRPVSDQLRVDHREDDPRNFTAALSVSAVGKFLRTHGVTLPSGSPGDPPQPNTIHGMLARHRQLFEAEVAARGVTVYPSAVGLLTRLRADGVRTALVTGSRHSNTLLSAAGAIDLFDARIDGSDAQRQGLPGKPDPAMLLEAARRLGVPPARTVVVEETEAGVEAGRHGQFGLVVGVDRSGNRTQLLAAGAHLVVTDLATLDLPALPSLTSVPSAWDGWAAGASSEGGPWLLTYDHYDPADEGTREALCTLGNGYWGTRGAAPEAEAGDVHYPGCYLAGVYNRLNTHLEGRTIENEHLVNAPNWLPLTFRTPEGGWFHPDRSELLDYRQELDLRRGILTRTLRFRDPAGRTSRVTSRRLVSQAAPHLAALETTFEAEDWSGELVVRVGLDGRTANRNVAEYRLLADQHLRAVTATEADQETVLLDTVTSQSCVRVAMAARTRVFDGEGQGVAPPRRWHSEGPAHAGQELTLTLQQNRPVTVEKVVAAATSRDRAISTPALAVQTWVSRAPGFADLLKEHECAWAQLWERFAVHVRAGERQALTLHLHVFHVLQTLSEAGADVDAGVPARGLHGEGYRGHVFWDELFIYPMLTLRRPELTRALLSYRYRRLDEARAAARAAGHQGAMFPWQSGSDGREETPTALYNLRSRRWVPDNSRHQRHIGLAVAYSVWQYYQATADVPFLIAEGAELLVEIARLFSSLATHDAGDDRYDITGVMGPDEFHDGYPGAPGQGIDNNAYTNIMTAWMLARTADALTLLTDHDCGSLWDRLQVNVTEVSRWEHVSRRLRVPFHPDGVLSQFEGYEQLAEFDWDRYRTQYGNIGRLDLILEAEGDSPNNYRLSKQADVLMLFYLLTADELRDVLDRLGYPLPADAIPRTVDFYLARTSHGSTLSRLVHSWVLARTDRHRSWSLFTQALDSDLADTQGGTTREGIHLAAMAGTVDLILRCYAGIETRGDVLVFNPTLPPELSDVAFEIVYRSQPITVELTPTQLRLRLHPGVAPAISVDIGGTGTTLHAGQVQDLPIATADAKPARSATQADADEIVGAQTSTPAVGSQSWPRPTAPSAKP